MTPKAPPAAALALAERIVAFWKARGVLISITLVGNRYGEWEVKSSLSGREPCEEIKIRREVSE